MTETQLARFIDRFTMEYLRAYPHPIERIWRAIVEPEEFRIWFIPGRLDPRVGGRYWFGDDGFQGAVTAIEPPRRLALADDNPGQTFAYELSEAETGTQMRFLHRFSPGAAFEEKPDPSVGAERSWELGGDLPGGLDTPWRPGFVAGFHDMFDRLGAFLAGDEEGARGNQARWSELIGVYRDHIRQAIPTA
jgi:uncharacterized protein YndB with AHSA1/START domain